MLDQFVITQLFTCLLIFCRIGAAVMIIPGVGEAYVPARVRLGFALGFAVLLTPVLEKHMPSPPSSVLMVTMLIAAETMVGLLFGSICRIMVSTMHTTGMLLAMVSGLSAAQMFDMNQSSQGSSIGNLLGMTALLLFFATDLHHLVFNGLADSYTLFPPGHFPPMDDFAFTAASLVSKAFLIAVQISTPLLVVALVVYVAAGILGRLMPIMPVFFIIVAPQLLISFFIIAITISAMMLWYMTVFKETLQGFIAP